MTERILQVEHLGKVIKGHKILEDITFSVSKGDCVALIGPNGAGKTTLMRCLLGDLRLSSGSVLVEGLEACHADLKARIAVLPQTNQVPEQLKVIELIRFFQKIAKKPLTDRAIDQLLGFSASQKEQLAEKLSGGQKRLLSFVLCLIGQPDLIFLDEPTAGMDTSTRRRFWEIIDQLKADGRTIIYSSHYIEEVEHTADRILVLHQGRLLRDTTPFTMRNEDQEKEVILPARFAPLVWQLEDIYRVEEKMDSLRFATKHLAQVWRVLQEAGCTIEDIEIHRKTLLDTLFEQTKEEANESPIKN